MRASCADLDKKIDAVETSKELESQFTELKEEVETLQAKLEVTNDYYAKRETEINAQLGTESAERYLILHLLRFLSQFSETTSRVLTKLKKNENVK